MKHEGKAIYACATPLTAPPSQTPLKHLHHIVTHLQTRTVRSHRHLLVKVLRKFFGRPEAGLGNRWIPATWILGIKFELLCYEHCTNPDMWIPPWY